eukprot:gene2661-5221_t
MARPFKIGMSYKWRTAICNLLKPLPILCLILIGLGVRALMKNKAFSAFSTKRVLRLVTWNMAAINNNPFGNLISNFDEVTSLILKLLIEYWITHDDPIYNTLMNDVSSFINSPGARDIPVHEVFSEDMFKELIQSMETVGWKNTKDIDAYWESMKQRKIVSEFIKDSVLGKKRLASMPDRFTNTINTIDKGAIMRPTVINCYNGDLSTQQLWWSRWKEFMFENKVSIKTRTGTKTIAVVEMLSSIKKSKYPAITEDEERISIPLQTLACAVFDAILVHMMNTVAPKVWQPLREDMCNKLNLRKIDRSIEILETTYVSSDVIFLQEVAAVFLEKAKNTNLSNVFHILFPIKLDGDRDQNSLILLKKSVFHQHVLEVTEEVLKGFGDSAVPAEDGDLFAIQVKSKSEGKKYLLASFHGDTNGLATIPIVKAMLKYSPPDHKLIFGLDANTYEHPSNDQQGVVAFADFYRENKLNSCYGPHPNPKNYTTFHARTHLQPQLNKAITFEEKDKKGDKNPKDFILFFHGDFDVISTTKDNTGSKKYIENMVFPTLAFPSDHGITSTVLAEK